MEDPILYVGAEWQCLLKDFKNTLLSSNQQYRKGCKGIWLPIPPPPLPWYSRIVLLSEEYTERYHSCIKQLHESYAKVRLVKAEHSS